MINHCYLQTILVWQLQSSHRNSRIIHFIPTIQSLNLGLPKSSFFVTNSLVLTTPFINHLYWKITSLMLNLCSQVLLRQHLPFKNQCLAKNVNLSGLLKYKVNSQKMVTPLPYRKDKNWILTLLMIKKKKDLKETPTVTKTKSSTITYHQLVGRKEVSRS